MASQKKTASTESLRYALFWEQYRVDYLYRHHRKTEALAAEMEVSKYRQRLRDELGVEVE